MLIRSSTALRSGYDEMVKLSKEAGEPVFLTRNGSGEMVFLPIELWERREAELNLLAELLRREENRTAGARTSSTADMEALTADLLSEGADSLEPSGHGDRPRSMEPSGNTDRLSNPEQPDGAAVRAGGAA